MLGFDSTFKRFLQTRDELSLSNIRRDVWPLLLIFPLTVILGDFRYFNLNIVFAGLQSYELMLYTLGLGWLVLAFVPKQFIFPLLKIAAVCCAVLLPFQLLLTDEISKLAAFMSFQFFNGICAACAFSFFCFKLNNIERLFGMTLILFYYSLYYTIYRTFPAVQAVYKTYGGILIMQLYLVVVFLLGNILKKPVFGGELVSETADTPDNGESRGGNRIEIPIIGTVIGLHIVYYSIMCMINYIESAENIIFSMPYGLGQLSSILIIIFFMLLWNRSALSIWPMFFIFSLLGITIVGYNINAAHFAGSLLYGLGDGLGYILIYYLCLGAIKKSKSIKMYRLFCIILFIEYFFISGLLSQAFDRHEGSNHVIALSVVVALSLCCFLILPYLQKKLFEADWTDGLYLKDMTEYKQGLADTDVININEHLALTEREHEVFTMLLKGMASKEIAYTLKISYPTVNFHTANLYRKLGVQSRSALFAKYRKLNVD